LEADGEQTPIDASAATPPSLRGTWFIALVAALVDQMIGRETQPNAAIQAEAEAEAGDSDGAELEKPGQERKHNDIKSAKIGPAAAAQKAGGRRRKATRK
jgi:DnaJ homolog subfamily C member 1